MEPRERVRKDRRRFLRVTGGALVGTTLAPAFGCVNVRRREADPLTPVGPPPRGSGGGSATDASAEEKIDAAAGLFLPAPDCSRARVMRCIAGIRPYRSSGVRMEIERIGERVIAHNYGHGGAGISLAWGCAERTVDLVAEAGFRDCAAAVIGAGVVGLTTAFELQRRGFVPSVYAGEFPPDTTSNIAGGQWAPSSVHVESPHFRPICERSFARYTELIGEEFAVFRRPNFVAGGGGRGLRRTPRGILPRPREYDRLPIEGRAHKGMAFETLLIEPPRFLDRLGAEVFESCETVERRRFASLEEALELPQPVIVNATGLGARDLCSDDDIVPIRGQLVLLEPQDLPYLLSHRGYMFPRSDAVVLGGTYEEGVGDPTPSPAACERIRRLTASYFGLETDAVSRRDALRMGFSPSA